MYAAPTTGPPGLDYSGSYVITFISSACCSKSVNLLRECALELSMIALHLVSISDSMKTLSVLAFVFVLLCGANASPPLSLPNNGSSVDAVTNLDAFDEDENFGGMLFLKIPHHS